jgi:hypothetical protein
VRLAFLEQLLEPVSGDTEIAGYLVPVKRESGRFRVARLGVKTSPETASVGHGCHEADWCLGVRRGEDQRIIGQR